MNKDLTSAIVKELFRHAIKRLSFLIIIFISQLAWANEYTKSFKDWTYYSSGNKYSRHCLIYSEPLRVKSQLSEARQAPYLYIRKRGVRQFSLGVYPGYEQDITKVPILTINGRKYPLKIELPDYSWTSSSVHDVSIIDEMIQASRFVTVHSYGIDGSVTLDYYSLKGFMQGLRQLDKCYPIAKSL